MPNILRDTGRIDEVAAPQAGFTEFNYLTGRTLVYPEVYEKSWTLPTPVALPVMIVLRFTAAAVVLPIEISAQIELVAEVDNPPAFQQPSNLKLKCTAYSLKLKYGMRIEAQRRVSNGF